LLATIQARKKPKQLVGGKPGLKREPENLPGFVLGSPVKKKIKRRKEREIQNRNLKKGLKTGKRKSVVFG